MTFSRVLGALEESGLLLLSDKSLPCVAKIVGGPGLKGSWWGHEKGHEIFNDEKRLEAHPDALLTRLVSGKVTYLHRRLWSDFLTVATSRGPWQTEKLPAPARRLLALVQEKGEVRMDKLGKGVSVPREAVKEAERRLLVYTDEIHTEKGSHAKVLMMWSRCPKLTGFRTAARSLPQAMETIEKLVDGLNAKFGGTGTLPWRQRHLSGTRKSGPP